MIYSRYKSAAKLRATPGRASVTLSPSQRSHFSGSRRRAAWVSRRTCQFSTHSDYRSPIHCARAHTHVDHCAWSLAARQSGPPRIAPHKLTRRFIRILCARGCCRAVEPRSVRWYRTISEIVCSCAIISDRYIRFRGYRTGTRIIIVKFHFYVSGKKRSRPAALPIQVDQPTHTIKVPS